jgi:two-component system invasion response regulator UvrY
LLVLIDERRKYRKVVHPFAGNCGLMETPTRDVPSGRSDQYQSILLVDDHELVRSGLKLLIESVAPGAEIIEASTGEQSIDIVCARSVDLVFMDIILPGIDGISSALRLINLRPDIKILILTGHTEMVVPRAVMESGICGYITKSSAAQEISNAMIAAGRGEFFMSGDLKNRLGDQEPELCGEHTPFDRLSNRELEVVLLLLKGYKTSDASASLTLNAKTISTYKRRAFDKLGVDSTAELIRLAIDHSILGY